MSNRPLQLEAIWFAFGNTFAFGYLTANPV